MKSLIVFLSILIIFLTCPASISAQQPGPALTLTLPELEWAFEINAPNFHVEKSTIAPLGDATYILARNKITNVILSVFLEKTSGNGTSKECRDYYWNGNKKSPLRKDQIKMYDFGEMAIVEYIIPEYLGVKVNQKNLNACLARDGYRIDIHLSKISSNTGEEGLLQNILGTVKINDAYTPTAFDLFQFGNLSFFRKDFQGAIPYYLKALELDKHRKNLGRERWIVLVDQLGMSYGFSGDLINARETYEWAITQEPEYPMFFFNLACTYAEMDQMGEAIRNLRLAYKYKGNKLPGENLPDPKSDPSLKKYLNNKTFIAEIQKIK